MIFITSGQRVKVVIDFTGLKVIQLFSCATQMGIIVQLLIKTKTPKNIGISCF